jgi:hypothetical protein
MRHLTFANQCSVAKPAHSDTSGRGHSFSNRFRNVQTFFALRSK